MKQSGEILLMLYDLQGRQLSVARHANQSIGEYQEVISMKNYPKGNYLLKIIVDKKIYGEKIVK